MPQKRNTQPCSCGCGEVPAYGRFMLGHHHRGKIRGTLGDRVRMRIQVVDDRDACHLWTGYVNRQGYGRIFSGPPRNTQILATHAVLELAGIPIKPGECVLHSCDTPACVNIRHLRIDDRAANNRESWERRRAAWQINPPDRRGERIVTAKLTAEDVLELRRRYARGDTTYERLAQERGLSLSTVHRAITGQTWKHL